MCKSLYDIKYRKNLKKKTNDSTYLKTKLFYKTVDDTWNVIDVEIRKRGNFRLKNCYYAPIKIKVKKSNSKGTLFEGNKSQETIVSNVTESQGSLEYAERKPPKGDVSYDIERVREYAEKAGKTIEEIGTTEEEITELLNAGYIAEAQEWLEYARGK